MTDWDGANLRADCRANAPNSFANGALCLECQQSAAVARAAAEALAAETPQDIDQRPKVRFSDIPVSIRQSRATSRRIKHTPLLACGLERSGVDQYEGRDGRHRALVLPIVGHAAHDDDVALSHGDHLSAVELDVDLP